jgi:hypothetical protein
MAALHDCFATAARDRKVKAKKVDPPGGTTGRVGCGTGVDEAPVPDAESTEAFSSEVVTGSLEENASNKERSARTFGLVCLKQHFSNRNQTQSINQ